MQDPLVVIVTYEYVVRVGLISMSWTREDNKMKKALERRSRMVSTLLLRQKDPEISIYSQFHLIHPRLIRHQGCG